MWVVNATVWLLYPRESGWVEPRDELERRKEKISRPHRCSNPEISSLWRSPCTDYVAPYNEHWVYNSFLSAIVGVKVGLLSEGC